VDAREPQVCQVFPARNKMLCSQYQLRKQGEGYEDVKILPCRSWSCEYCAPKRRSQLMAIAASGNPRSCLTLTCTINIESSPSARYRRLHNAWKLLIKRILRQFMLPPEQRWMLQTEEGNEYQEIIPFQITKATKAKRIRKIHYMAFVEETEAGEPHLHIMLRTVFIPQRWLSQQMDDLLSSPIIWIEKIKGVRSAIAYVTKYVTKAPAQFGKSRRYWLSRHYQINKVKFNDAPLMDRRNSRLVMQRFTDFVQHLLQKGVIAVPIERELLRVYELKSAWSEFRDGDRWRDCPEITKAYLWLHSYKQRCAL
jgi:hypothetical protein